MKVDDPEGSGETLRKHTGTSPESLAEGSLHSTLVFAEFFAGRGDLTKTLKEQGIACREADDAATGGLDFDSAEDLLKLKE